MSEFRHNLAWLGVLSLMIVLPCACLVWIFVVRPANKEQSKLALKNAALTEELLEERRLALGWLDPKHLILGKKLGEGAYGLVSKGRR